MQILKSGPMAMNAVLGTAELLVSILQELDIKTLLLARRVSQQWLHAIELQKSPKLARRPAVSLEST
jgi:hypothetical protein